MGHQHVSVQRATESPRRLCQHLPELEVIHVRGKAGATIIAALDHVLRDPGKIAARTSSHASSRS